VEIVPSKEEYKALEEKSEKITEYLERALRKKKIGANVFVGGSFAKKTLVKKESHDIDIYVRFDLRYENISSYLETVVNEAFKRHKKLKIEKIHGSRDYFRVIVSPSLTFEIIPVSEIAHPRESRNVTDLSYFHVRYFKKQLPEFNREVALAKTFCRSAGVYGAESYIHGFSGYALECLIYYYGSFVKMLRALVSLKDRTIIDPAKFYGKKESPLIFMNESKLLSPIILIDPTWKERNALAALSKESFEVFQNAARAFLARPSVSYFEFHPIHRTTLERFVRNKKAEILHIRLTTDKQAGDIAGTKLKKFFEFLANELSKEFEVITKVFQYDNREHAEVFYVVKAKREVIKIGPPVKMEKHASAFRKIHKKVFEKDGFLHARIKTSGSAKEYMSKFVKGSLKKMKEMSVKKLEVG
jgi:tRNA nucleotidyltransferase (CCA-adding enzyme)